MRLLLPCRIHWLNELLDAASYPNSWYPIQLHFDVKYSTLYRVVMLCFTRNLHALPLGSFPSLPTTHILTQE